MTTATWVTGLGVAAPNGLGVEAYWEATKAGESGIGTVTRFDPTSYPARLAGEIDGFVAEDHLPARLLPQTDRMTRIALVAADWALENAGVVPGELSEFDMGVITASSSGGFEFGQNELRALWSQGGQYVSAYQSFAWFYAVNSGQISIRNGMRGPSSVVVSDQAGGLDALAQARRQIRKGTPVILSGAVDASICPWGWVAQLASDRLSTEEDPGRAYVPFDDGAGGHNPDQRPGDPDVLRPLRVRQPDQAHEDRHGLRGHEHTPQEAERQEEERLRGPQAILRQPFGLEGPRGHLAF